MGYTGRRMSGSRSHSRRSEAAILIQTLERVLLFPALLLYLELVLHIYMKTSLAYAPVYVIFSFAAGFFLSALTLAWTPKVNSILSKVLAVVISVIFVVEIIAKTILQTYYGPSALGVAAGNKLTDYADVIISTVIHSIPIILILLLPAVLLCIFGKSFPGFDRFDVRFAGLVLGACVVCHILAIGVTLLPWKGDITPAMLYKVDTNVDDQVEQLGMFTMLRLDVKHMLFPPKNSLDSDFSGIGTLTPPGAPPAAMSPPGTAPRPGSRCRWWTPPPTCWTSTWPPWRRAGRMTI